jgi:hypothetical protein
VSSIYQQLQTRSILKEPIVVIEGLKIKPNYLEMQVMQVEITFCVISS